MESISASYIPVWLAVIAAIPLVLLPLLQNWLTARNVRKDKLIDADTRRAEKQFEWDRQDKVAAAVLEVANKTAQRTAEVATDLRAANDRAAAAADEQIKLAKETHALVNSSMTTVKQLLLDSLEAQLILLNTSVMKDKLTGIDVGVESLATIKSLKDKIVELKSDIADRLLQQAVAAGKTI